MSSVGNPEEYINAEITLYLKSSRRGQKWWSFATHGSTVLIVIFSAIAAVLSQTPNISILLPTHSWATILSLLVTVISTTQSKLGFDRKWKANRMTHNALIQLDIDNHMGKTSDLATALKDILLKHDQAIISG